MGVGLVLAAGTVAGKGHAQARPPSRFYGAVTVNGRPPEAGTTVQARVGSTICGTGTVTAGGSYAVDVASAATRPGCGTEGAIVTFLVGGVPASGTGRFQGGAFVLVDLTAGRRLQVFPDYDGATDYICWDDTSRSETAYRVDLWKLVDGRWQHQHSHELVRSAGESAGQGWTCFGEDVKAELGAGLYLYGLQVRQPADGGSAWQHEGFSAWFRQ